MAVGPPPGSPATFPIERHSRPWCAREVLVRHSRHLENPLGPLPGAGWLVHPADGEGSRGKMKTRVERERETERDGARQTIVKFNDFKTPLNHNCSRATPGSSWAGLFLNNLSTKPRSPPAALSSLCVSFALAALTLNRCYFFVFSRLTDRHTGLEGKRMLDKIGKRVQLPHDIPCGWRNVMTIFEHV